MLYVRPPVAAGRFYDIDSERLKRQLDVAFKRSLEERDSTKPQNAKLKGAVVPHAGYEYSGSVAAAFYSQLDPASARNYIIIGPNHYFVGSPFSIMKSGLWKTPLGGVAINENMSNVLLEKCKILENDVMAHQNEHSVEVQLPFLQKVFGGDFKFVPISIANETPDDDMLKACQTIGECVADSVKKSKDKWIILASSDLSHYITSQAAKDTDSALINSIVRLKEKQLFQKVKELNATACGFGPIAALIVAAKILGVKKGRLLKYVNSGDVTGDINSVVGYASIAF
jgi:MEMO1 family protein